MIAGATNVTSTVNVGSQPYAVAANPVTNMIYVGDYGDGTVTEINGSTNTPSTINVGNRPTEIAVNPVTNQIYVVNSADGTVTVSTAPATTRPPQSPLAQIPMGLP